MKAMLDKDLDQLFKKRFDTFETEPNSDVWNAIANQLDGKRAKKKAYPLFWMAAASIVIIISAGLWFYRPVEVIKLHGTADDQMAVVKPDETILKSANETSSNASENPVSKENGLIPVKSVEIQKKRIVFYHQNAMNLDRKLIKRNSVIALVKQDTEVLAQTKTDVNLSDKIKPMLLANIDNKDPKIETKQETPRKRIRSIGSLVNFVIAQVDKREDKIIEFKDDDDGSEVSGINLGIVKFKGKNN